MTNLYGTSQPMPQKRRVVTEYKYLANSSRRTQISLLKQQVKAFGNQSCFSDSRKSLWATRICSLRPNSCQRHSYGTTDATPRAAKNRR